MEGIVIRLDKVLQTVYLRDLVKRPPEMCIIVSGGVLERVKEWRQLLADITGTTTSNYSMLCFVISFV